MLFRSVKFRPCKAILIFWLFYCLGGALAAGAFAAGMVEGGESGTVVPLETAFLVSSGVVFVISALYARLFYSSIIYELDEKYITRSSGVLWKRRRSIPLSKITNIDVRQGPLERILGFGQIWIYTPSTGGDKPEEKLIGVIGSHEMKSDIIRRSEAAKSSDTAQKSEGQAVLAESNQVLEDIRDSLLRIEKILQSKQDEKSS